MATYDDWNIAIAEYFVSGLPDGASVYLSVDHAALEDIGFRTFNESPPGKWVEDFEAAVRSQCVPANQIDLRFIQGTTSHGLPRAVAFLAAMVLAASRMAEEDFEIERVADTNYFTRLREVLGLTGSGRPPGLQPPGVEQPFWESWNRWILQNGWLPSAEYGQDIASRYISYPLSQVLLREGDKERLERAFRDEERAGRLSRTWDIDRLGNWLRVRGGDLLTTRHLRELIQEADQKRYSAFVDSVFDVYASMSWDQAALGVRASVGTSSQRRLMGGLYRVEDGISGTIDYYLYPRQARRIQAGLSNLRLSSEGRSEVLREERSGWFFPLAWTVDPGGGVSFSVEGDQRIKELVLPQRGFWILVRDPDSPQCGVFANWRQPQVGETFLLLSKSEYANQLDIFREENLLQWEYEFPLTGSYDGWIEYRECMILSQNWDGIIPQKGDLYDALKPELPANIVFRGGLRLSDQIGVGWLEGLQPDIQITAFEDGIATLRIININQPEIAPIEVEAITNKGIENIPLLKTGIYLLQAQQDRGSRAIPPRSLRIVDWQALDSSPPKQFFGLQCGVFSLHGAVIHAETGVSDEDDG